MTEGIIVLLIGAGLWALSGRGFCNVTRDMSSLEVLEAIVGYALGMLGTFWLLTSAW